MFLRYSSRFKRMYRKLPPEQQESGNRALQLFTDNPFHPQLHNHKLAGSKQGIRSISAGYDLRILYTEEHGHAIVLLLMIGDHATVYQ